MAGSVIDWPTGLTVYDRERAWPGYTLYAPFQSPLVYLLEMDGEVVHLWSVPVSATERGTIHAKYVGNGHILFAARHATTEAWLYEKDWQSNLVWSYMPSGSPEDPHNARDTVGWDTKYRARSAHHDFQRLPNGNTLLLCSARVTNPAISDHELASDYFLEITPDGTPVWIWHSDQHFEEFGFGEETRRLMREAPGAHMGLPLGDYLHTNTLEVLPETDLGHRDARFRAGNLLGCQRNTNTIFVVDRHTGAVVWTWGRDQLVGPHHPNMLANGNIIVYDNGGQAGYPRRSRIYTRLVELDPASGTIVWQYVHQPRRFYHHQFFSWSWGSAQRLSNGNTFSLDANRGRLFEVTPEGEIVWEYVNGFAGLFQFGGMKRIEYGVYRAYRIPYEAVPNFSADFRREDHGQATLRCHPPLA